MAERMQVMVYMDRKDRDLLSTVLVELRNTHNLDLWFCDVTEEDDD